MDGQGLAKASPVGYIGHYMSKRYITTVAVKFSPQIKMAGSLYGVGIVTDHADSTHSLLPEIQGELHYVFAEVNQHVPENVISGFKGALAKTKLSIRLRSKETPRIFFVFLNDLHTRRRPPKLSRHAYLKCVSGS